MKATCKKWKKKGRREQAAGVTVWLFTYLIELANVYKLVTCSSNPDSSMLYSDSIITTTSQPIMFIFPTDTLYTWRRSVQPLQSNEDRSPYHWGLCHQVWRHCPARYTGPCKVLHTTRRQHWRCEWRAVPLQRLGTRGEWGKGEQ